MIREKILKTRALEQTVREMAEELKNPIIKEEVNGRLYLTMSNLDADARALKAYNEQIDRDHRDTGTRHSKDTLEDMKTIKRMADTIYIAYLELELQGRK